MNAHDARNHIGRIIGLADLMSQQTLSEVHRKYLFSILDSAQAILDVFNEEQPPNESSTNHDSKINGLRLRSLFIEDEPINQMVVGNMLSSYGIYISVVSDGIEALSVLQKDSGFDFILLDLELPNLSGFETAKIIRNIPSTSEVPIIAISGHSKRELFQNFSMQHFDGFVAKPVSSDRLFAEITSVLEGVKKIQTQSNNYTNQLSSEIKRILIEAIPQWIEDLEQANTHKNYMLLHKHAHKMKSSLSQVGKRDIASLLEEIEISINERKQVSEGVIELINARLLRFLNQLSLEETTALGFGENALIPTVAR